MVLYNKGVIYSKIKKKKSIFIFYNNIIVHYVCTAQSKKKKSHINMRSERTQHLFVK